MKITEEYIDNQIAFVEKNLKYATEHQMEQLSLIYQGELIAWNECKFHKTVNGRRICWIGIKRGLRRKLVILLSRWLDKLRGVE